MKKITLRIENPYERETVVLEDEVTIGRTDQSQVVLSDQGLSRRNTTFFRDGDECLVVDENSLNGTFVNGERIAGAPVRVFDGDRVTLGSETRVTIEIAAAQTARPEEKPVAPPPTEKPKTTKKNPKSEIRNPQSSGPPIILMVAAGSAVLILVLGVAALLVVNRFGLDKGNTQPTPQIAAGLLIPVRVIDPLGGEDPDDLDDLIASWEVEEDPLKTDDLKEIQSVSTTDATKPSDLNVSIEFFNAQRDKALNHGATGAEPAGLIPLPVELVGGNVSKQKAKLAEMIRSKGYKQPMDFADLAQLRLEGKFVGEMPMATETYVLDIGGSATGEEFTSFDFDTGVAKLTPDSPKYKILKQLADNFDGQKYDLNNPVDRKQMRIRLLRMYNKDSRKLFEQIMSEFYQRFKVPMRVTSLLRSMDYQISLNKTNSNSFKVSGKGSLPPHTSGCAFDVSRRNLTRDEQNWIMTRFAELEGRDHKIDSLREGNANACFHTFIYPDGIEPTNLNLSLAEIINSNSLAENFLIPELSGDDDF
ncbi:MAG: FHA domain-containing protein [Acidobacteria bacterium]|nr:FHA domain-containing protein [Acidobacteriota bacterium]